MAGFLLHQLYGHAATARASARVHVGAVRKAEGVHDAVRALPPMGDADVLDHGGGTRRALAKLHRAVAVGARRPRHPVRVVVARRPAAARSPSQSVHGGAFPFPIFHVQGLRPVAGVALSGSATPSAAAATGVSAIPETGAATACPGRWAAVGERAVSPPSGVIVEPFVHPSAVAPAMTASRSVRGRPMHSKTFQPTEC